MKKIICIVLILAMLLVAATGCTGGLSDKMEDAVKSAMQEELGDTGATEEEAVTDAEATDTVVIDSSGTLPLYESYAQYTEAKGTLTTAVMDIASTDENLLFATMELAGLALSDLALIPLTICGLEEMDVSYLEMLGMMNAEYKSNGNEYSVTYKDSEGGTTVMEAKYDPATESVTAKILTDGEFSMVSEYTRTGNGYAGQTWYPSDDGSFTISKITIDSADAMSGTIGIVNAANQEPTSIFGKGGSIGQDFAKDADNWYSLADGKFSASVDGQSYGS